MGFSRQEYWFAIPFSSGPHSVRTLHHDPPVLGGPTGMAWFHWVRQGCGPSVIRSTSFLWVWFQCVCFLMPSCNTYHLTWVSLTLDVSISSWVLQQSTATAPYLGWVVSPHCRLSWPWIWSNSSRPSCVHAATTPWTWGCSSRLPHLTLDVG